ncbi:MAG: hypothetical protein ACKPEA_00185, partial [Planctomycetota bacterium]
RFMERQRMLVDEANAIGTAWLCADLLPDPERAAMRQALSDVVRARAVLARTTEPSRIEELDLAIETAQGHLWDATSLGLRATPAVVAVVAPAVHHVIDQHGARKAAARQHLPTAVLVLLGLASALALGTVGFAEGVAGVRTRLVSIALVLLVAASLWVTVDIDHPRRGLIRIDASAILELETRFVSSRAAG